MPAATRHLCMDGVSSWSIADSIEVAIAKTSVIRQLRGHRRHFELTLWLKAAPNRAIAGPKGQNSPSRATADTTTPGYENQVLPGSISNGVRLMFRKIMIVLATPTFSAGD